MFTIHFVPYYRASQNICAKNSSAIPCTNIMNITSKIFSALLRIYLKGRDFFSDHEKKVQIVSSGLGVRNASLFYFVGEWMTFCKTVFLCCVLSAHRLGNIGIVLQHIKKFIYIIAFHR